MTEKCKDCRWIERYDEGFICGYVAEVYLLARRVEPESACEINKHEKRRCVSMSIPDNYNQWERHDRAQTQTLERQPRCAICDSRIQDEYLYVINDEPICTKCLIRDFRRDTDEFVC